MKVINVNAKTRDPGNGRVSTKIVPAKANIEVKNSNQCSKKSNKQQLAKSFSHCVGNRRVEGRKPKGMEFEGKEKWRVGIE